MNLEIPWRAGFEVELLAPTGLSRLSLAEAIASEFQGTVHRTFLPQIEPSEVPGKPLFYNLTLGFEVRDLQGCVQAHCVDDLTLQADLDRKTPPAPGWYRILSDDERLLRLIQQNTQAELPLLEVLVPLGRLFGTVPKAGPAGMVRVDDLAGASVAMAAPLPGERERPCEVITPAWEDHQGERLERLLKPARNLGFTIPKEGAVHVHFEASELCSARTLSRFVQIASPWLGHLRRLFQTNPFCRRLGPWPEKFLRTVQEPSFCLLPWERAKEHLRSTGLTKYCDLNLLNILSEHPKQRTIELRILPVHLQVEPIIRAAQLFATILSVSASEHRELPAPPESDNLQSLKALFASLGCDENLTAHWLKPS